MSISPPESHRSDPLSPLAGPRNPSSGHGSSPLLSPSSGGSPPVSAVADDSFIGGGGAPPVVAGPESDVAVSGDSLNPSQKVIGFQILDSSKEGTSSQSQSYGTQPANNRRNQGVNANYLLNFYYDPISRPQNRGLRPSPVQRKQRKIKPYNKDLFLQANYKFVVLDTGNYEIESMDPDKMLQWEDIVCVKYRTPATVQCPICLESPLCPQITSCGHIYCFPCILQYLLMGEENYKAEHCKRCPLCFMMISIKDLYTVIIENLDQFRVGVLVTFALLSRSKSSLFPLLKNRNVECSVPLKEEVESESFAKFVLTNDAELSVREAKSDLTDWLKRADLGLVDDLGQLPYVCAALEQLEERMKYWMEYSNRSYNSSGSSPPLKNSTSPPSAFKGSMVGSYKGRSDVADLNSSGYNNDTQIDVSISEALENGNEKDLEESLSKGGKEDDSYTFYQSADGQLIILHPLNMKCLLHHYGTHDSLPPRISGKILEMETVIQSEAIRRRFRFLSHFSLTTTFQMCEIDLSGTLPPSSLSPFMEEIKKRDKQRKQLARKEEKERAKAEAMDAAASAMRAPDPRIYSHSPKDVMFSLDDFEALGSRNPAPSSSPPTSGERKQLFSDVTRLGYASGHDSPLLNHESATNTGGTSNLEGATGAAPAMSFANIISATRGAETNREALNGIVGKKGKKQNRVLLSTAGGRRY